VDFVQVAKIIDEGIHKSGRNITQLRIITQLRTEC
jgi:hypothetical protein